MAANPVDILVEEVSRPAQEIIMRMKKGSAEAKADLEEFLRDIKGNLGVAMDTAIKYPTEETHRRSLEAAANAIWLRTMADVETFTVAQKYELRAAFWVAFRVVVRMATGVALA